MIREIKEFILEIGKNFREGNKVEIGIAGEEFYCSVTDDGLQLKGLHGVNLSTYVEDGGDIDDIEDSLEVYSTISFDDASIVHFNQSLAPLLDEAVIVMITTLEEMLELNIEYDPLALVESLYL